MARKDITAIAAAAYGSRGTLKHLGTENGIGVFGFIDNEVVVTMQQPFYVTVDSETGEIAEQHAAMYDDDAYFLATFHHLETKYKFYERNGIFE